MQVNDYMNDKKWLDIWSFQQFNKSTVFLCDRKNNQAPRYCLVSFHHTKTRKIDKVSEHGWCEYPPCVCRMCAHLSVFRPWLLACYTKWHWLYGGLLDKHSRFSRFALRLCSSLKHRRHKKLSSYFQFSQFFFPLEAHFCLFLFDPSISCCSLTSIILVLLSSRVERSLYAHSGLFGPLDLFIEHLCQTDTWFIQANI